MLLVAFDAIPIRDHPQLLIEKTRVRIAPPKAE